jgi:hypothetical protein
MVVAKKEGTSPGYSHADHNKPEHLFGFLTFASFSILTKFSGASGF